MEDERGRLGKTLSSGKDADCSGRPAVQQDGDHQKFGDSQNFAVQWNSCAVSWGASRRLESYL
eukprot:1154109-Pelagomonas_calceolata.AAC.6